MRLNQILSKLNSPSSQLGSGEITHKSGETPFSLEFGKTGAAQTFWTAYMNAVDSGDKLSVSEKVPEFVPVIIDFKLSFDTPQDDLASDIDNFSDIISICQNTILNCVICDDDDSVINCALLTGKDVVRLHFMNCKISRQNTKELVKRIKGDLRLKNAKSFFESEPIGSWDTIVSSPTSKSFMMLYGSAQVPELPLKLVGFSTINGSEKSLENVCFLANHSHISTNLIPEEFVDSVDSPLWFLPFVLSMGFRSEISVTSFEETDLLKSLDSFDKSISSSYEQKNIASLLPLLSEERFKEKHCWLDIGRAIYHSYDGSDDGLSLWKDFTMNTFGESIEELYEDFDINTRITEDTVKFYAAIDSPDLYGKILNDKCYNLFLDAISGTMTSGDSAALIDELYGLNYVSDGNYLYFFDGNVWQDHGDMDYVKLFSTRDGDFIKRVGKWCLRLTEESVMSDHSLLISKRDTEAKRARAEVNTKKAAAYRDKIKKLRFKGEILKDFKGLKGKRELAFDDAINLTGVRGGILEAMDEKIIFRKGKPEDYIKKCCPTRWDRTMSFSHPRCRALLEWFTQMFPNKDSRDYFKRFCGYLLISGNGENIFPFWTGGGGNSKGTVKKLIEAAIGPYCVDIPVSYLMNTRRGGPNPELAQCAGSRVVFMQEPKSGEMDESTFKTLSGDDSYFARNCNKNGGSIKSTFVPVLICNEIPTMNIGEAEKRRLAILKFMSRWVEDPPKDKIERYRTRTFKKDPEFKKVIPKLTSAFLWYCAQGYEEYKKYGLSPPKSMKTANVTYIEDADYILDFFNQRVMESFLFEEDGTKMRREDSKLACDDLIKNYGEWLTLSNPYKKRETMKRFIDRVSKIVGHSPTKGCWSGFKLSKRFEL